MPKSREKLKPKTISIRYIKGTQETTKAPGGLTWNILSNNNKKHNIIRLQSKVNDQYS